MTSPIRSLASRIHTTKWLTVLVWGISVLLLAIAATSVWHVKQMQIRSEEIHSRNVVSIRAAVELELHIQELRHQLDRYLLMSVLRETEADVRPQFRLISNERSSIDRWLREAEASANTTEELRAISQVREGLLHFDVAIENVTAASDVQETRKRLARRAEEILEDRVLAPARTYLKLDEQSLADTNAEASRQSHRLMLTLSGLGVFGAMVAMIAGFSLSRMINHSLFEIRIPIQDVAGKLSEVAGDVLVSTRLDLADIGPMLQRVSAEVTDVVEQLQQRHQEILHADQLASVGQLAAGIAHEIRNPLMSMKLLVQSARGQELQTLDELDLKILDEEIRRLEVLLDEFLEFARPKPLDKRVVDMRDLAENVVSFLQPQADVRNVSIECEVPSFPVQISVDAPRIRQVLLNLLLNGIQVTPRGGVVCLEMKSPDQAGGPKCEIRIRDDGPGIGSELAERIFEPFFSTKETGLGLGLAVSQRIVRSHGGELSVESANRGGAMFIVSLPLEASESPAGSPGQA